MEEAHVNEVHLNEPQVTCGHCRDDLVHCHGVLVLHADGRVECDEVDDCDEDVVTHIWEVACIDLGCGCLGDEHELAFLAAA